jgi:NitT/TauT family transport system ATP-binding protein
MMELDDVLPIVEAGELLGFLVVQEGDLMITPLGEAYAEASILSRKEMLAGRVFRLPIIRWIYETLQKDESHRVPDEYFLERLEPEFQDMAEQQLEAAINWGRFAELFAFDDDTDELYLENK